MSIKTYAAIAVAMIVVAASPAHARRAPQKHGADIERSDSSEWPRAHMRHSEEDSEESSERHERHRHMRSASARHHSDDDDSGERHHSGVGPRPGAWCGWYMRTRHGGGPEMNLAANWRHYGSPGSPQVGAIVVWPHHVGEIVGQASNGQWIVLSGNDGGAVRRRPRSIAGATVRV